MEETCSEPESNPPGTDDVYLIAARLHGRAVFPTHPAFKDKFSMSLITATALGKSFGAQDVFSGITVSIPKHARIGLVGPNGVGKTTLLRILLGAESASEGSVLRAKGLRMGYLAQETPADSHRTLWDECLGALESVLKTQQTLRELEGKLALTPDDGDLMTRYGRLQERFEASGGYTYESRVRQVLSGLGFTREDETRPLSQLSGGQRTRAVLARLLLSESRSAAAG